MIGKPVIEDPIAAAEHQAVRDAVRQPDSGREVLVRRMIDERGWGQRETRKRFAGIRCLDKAGRGLPAGRRSLVEPVVEIAAPAEHVDGPAEVVPAKSEIQRETGGHLPVVLEEEAHIGNAVRAVGDAAGDIFGVDIAEAGAIAALRHRRTGHAEQEIRHAADCEGAAITVSAVVVVVITAGFDAGPQLVFAVHPGKCIAVMPRCWRDALIIVHVVADAERARYGDRGNVRIIGRVEAVHADVAQIHDGLGSHDTQHARNAKPRFVD